MLTASLTQLPPRLRVQNNKPNIENLVFKLHYKGTVALLLFFVIIVCWREYFGEHIRCISDLGVAKQVIQTYCFFMATFTVVRHYNESLLQTGFLPHPGVGPMLGTDQILHHKFYQWVPFVLFIQSVCFYIPHYIWKKNEGGIIKALVDGLQYASMASQEKDVTVNKKTVVPSKETIENKIGLIKKYIFARLQILNSWSNWLIAMEVLNFLHVVFQIWLIDIFLDGEFLNLGKRVLIGSWDGIADPLETIFPKVTKCLFHKYGPSGTIQQHDALCVMALNVIYEKIYTVLWFWLLFLFIVSLLVILWRAISFFLYRRSLKFNQMIFRQVSSVHNPFDIVNVVNGCRYGDWLFLYYLAKNMHGLMFKELFAGLAKEFEKREWPYNREDYKETVEVHLPLTSYHYCDETISLKFNKKST